MRKYSVDLLAVSDLKENGIEDWNERVEMDKRSEEKNVDKDDWKQWKRIRWMMEWKVGIERGKCSKKENLEKWTVVLRKVLKKVEVKDWKSREETGDLYKKDGPENVAENTVKDLKENENDDFKEDNVKNWK